MHFDGWDNLQRVDGLIMGVPVAFAAIVLSGFSAVAVRRYVQSARFVSLGQMLLGGKWQFSLSSLLGLTAACAVALTVLAVLPDSAGSIILAVGNLFMPVALTTIVVYGPPASRTFCIGALFPASLSFFVVGCLLITVFFEGKWSRFPGDNNVTFGLRIVTCIAWLAMVATGRLAQASRGYFARVAQRDN